MPKVSAIQPTLVNSVPTPPAAIIRNRGRWKWGLGILFVACVAQAILWTMWWDNPTFFKMSVLFVWPAGLFALMIWWLFFSGWSWVVRVGTLAAIIVGISGFLGLYRLEFDGDMVPRRLALRSTPSAEEVARKFFQTQSVELASIATPKEEAKNNTPLPLVAVEGDWTGFRGPRRDGIVQGASLRRNWSAAPPREVWRHPIGRAWSAFIIVGNYAFTQEQRDEYECVVAYDAETGRQKWIHQDQALLSIVDANGGPGPHATPEFDDGLIYTVGGTGILNCLDALTGQPFWSTNILRDASDEKDPIKQPEWGVSCSPLVTDDLVIVIPGSALKETDPASGKGVIAYNKKSGQIVWTAGKHPASYGSPRVETILGTRQVLIPNGNGLSSHRLTDGQELWFYPLENGPKVNSAMPWLLGDRSLLFGTGYGVGSVRIELRQENDDWKASQGWSSNRFRPKFNDFVVHEGCLYGLDDGTLTCVDVESGKIRWKSERCGYGQLLLIDGLLLIMTEDGDLKLTAAISKKPETMATFKVFDSGYCWNHLAFARGRLYARNANEAVCLDISGDDNGR